jgi:hypothetical protein
MKPSMEELFARARTRPAKSGVERYLCVFCHVGDADDGVGLSHFYIELDGAHTLDAYEAVGRSFADRRWFGELFGERDGVERDSISAMFARGVLDFLVLPLGELAEGTPRSLATSARGS